MSRFDRLFLGFLAAVIAVDIVVVNQGVRMSSFHRSLYERGREVAAEVTGHTTRPAIRGPDNHYYSYTYQDANGASFEGETLLHDLDVGDTITVTYLPESPDDHVLFAMSPGRIRQPIRASGTFAVASVTVTLLFGMLGRRALGQREIRATERTRGR